MSYLPQPDYTSGQVLFGDGDSIPTTDDDFVWSVANNRLEIGQPTGIGVNDGTGVLVVNGLFKMNKGFQSFGVGNGAVSGNARGQGAVDLQFSRTAATQVASGVYSCLAGGTNNTASGAYSAVVGGTDNTASGDYSGIVASVSSVASGHYSGVWSGDTCIASGDYSAVLGAGCTASGTHSFAGGLNCVASGNHSVAYGEGSTATAASSAAFGKFSVASARASLATGLYAYTWLPAQTGFAQGFITSQRDAGGGWVHWRGATAGTGAATELLIDTERFVLEDDTAYSFEINALAWETTGALYSSWQYTGTIRRNVGAATVTFVPAATVGGGQIFVSGGWGVTLVLTADVTNGALVLTLTNSNAQVAKASAVGHFVRLRET